MPNSDTIIEINIKTASFTTNIPGTGSIAALVSIVFKK